jgi:hypothetical protein
VKWPSLDRSKFRIADHLPRTVPFQPKACSEPDKASQ